MIDPGERGQDDAIRDLGERWVKAIASATLEGGERRQSDSHTLTVLRKIGANAWRVARVIGVVERAERSR